MVVCLGAFAWDAALRLRRALDGPGAPAERPRPRFGHGAEAPGEPWPLLGCYHPSQQNTFTGQAHRAMLDDVLARAIELRGGQVAGARRVAFRTWPNRRATPAARSSTCSRRRPNA